jgi:hypothetical protein
VVSGAFFRIGGEEGGGGGGGGLFGRLVISIRITEFSRY